MKAKFHISLYTASVACAPAQRLVITRAKRLRLLNSERLWRSLILQSLMKFCPGYQMNGDFDFEGDAEERPWKPSHIVFGSRL